ncbi:MAG: anti-sigma factor domain-containing protein [Verrucomicrobiales bacterium]
MIERDAIELAGLDAVGLLDGNEHQDFVRECRLNPECRRAAAEMRDIVATVAAASTPPVSSPPRALAGIYARVQEPGLRERAIDGARPNSHRLPAWLPWAIAATFAALAAWDTWTTRFSGSARLPESGISSGTPPSPSASHSSDAVRLRQQPGSSPLQELGPGPRKDSVPPGYFTQRTTGPSGRLSQDSTDGRRDSPPRRLPFPKNQDMPPGVSDLRVVEMLPPGVTVAADKQDLLSARIAAAVAAGLEPPPADTATPNPESPPAQRPVEINVDGTPPAPDILIKDSQVPDLHSFNLPETSQIRHAHFPPESEYEALGFTRLTDGTVYDGRGGLWYLSENGAERIGVLAPDGWSPPEPGDAAAGPPDGLRPGLPTPESNPSFPSSPDGEAPAAAIPYALPIVDQEGRGTLIVQNLPAAPDGHLYHLWMIDSGSSSPVNLGTLKSETGAGQYGFDLPSPGFIPSRYLMTLEKVGTVTAPGEAVVLQGP